MVSREIVPEHGGILEVGLRVSLLSMDKDGEFGRVTEEEDWSVVENPIPVAFFRVKLNGKASGVASTIWRALFTTNG
jgi:hypothetical protein